MVHDLKNLSAVETLQGLHNKEFSAVDYATDLVGRIEANTHLNTIQCFDADLLLDNAQKADNKRAAGIAGSLCGLPFIAKDNINSTSFPTTGGTGALIGHTPELDADVIISLQEADAILAGKANMHELALGITSNNTITGAVHNPHGRNLIPGGSSGGTAAAVAAEIFPVGLGTDTGGSCRIPAALCGVVGFRPTTGRYSSAGIMPISHTRDTVGPLARTVADIALLDAVLSRKPRAISNSPMANITLGIPKDVLYENLEPQVKQAIDAQLQVLEASGVRLIEVDMTSIWSHNEAFGFPVVLYELMRDLPAYIAQHVPHISFDDLITGIGSPDVAGLLGSQLGSEAMPLAAYRAAMDTHRPAMRQIYAQTFAKHQLNAIVMPTTPLTARKIGEDETIGLNGQLLPTFTTYIRNTDLASNLGAPGISLPCQNISGLPVGIELDGLPGQDDQLLAVASTIEAILKL